MSVADGHEIATLVEQALRQRYGADTFISIHIEPQD